MLLPCQTELLHVTTCSSHTHGDVSAWPLHPAVTDDVSKATLGEVVSVHMCEKRFTKVNVCKLVLGFRQLPWLTF